jgi:hypothetical protein
MTELLRGSLGDTRFPDLSSTGYQTSRSALGSDLYMNERNSNIQMQLKTPVPSPSLCSPFEQRRDTNAYQQDSYLNNFTGSAYMQTVSAYIPISITLDLTHDIYETTLRQATEQDLLAVQNAAYLRLFTENITLNSRIQALE